MTEVDRTSRGVGSSDSSQMDRGGTREDLAAMSREEVIARNLKVVEAHFHNETPDTIDRALALYADDIVWEAPARGQVYTDADEVRRSYLDIFRTVHWNRSITLRRFATEDFVFDDQIADLTVVGEGMPNLGFVPGDHISMRLVHLFEMRDGKIAREIAYEVSRRFGGPLDKDSIPVGATVTEYPDGPHFNELAPVAFEAGN